MSLRRLTEAEIAAANLRRMARDLVLEAERLEASVPASAAEQGHVPRKRYVDPGTGKPWNIKREKI